MDVVVCVVGACGVFDESDVPDVGDAHFVYVVEYFGGEVVELAAAVGVFVAAGGASEFAVAEEAGQYGVYCYFVFVHLWFVFLG